MPPFEAKPQNGEKILTASSSSDGKQDPFTTGASPQQELRGRAWRATDSNEVETENDGAHIRLHAKTFLAIFAVCLIYFAQLFSLVGAGAQSQTIAGHFNDTASTVWVSASITIMIVVLSPIVSQAADYWGRKWFLVILPLFGAIGSIIVARATSMGMAIAGFTILGVSFGTQPLLHTVPSEVLPRRWRGYGQAADMASNCFGSVASLLVGGALNRTNDPKGDGFRYYFYINMALFLVAAVLCAVVYNPPERPEQRRFTTAEKLAKLDWIGYGLLAGGLVLFCMALSWSRNPYEWSDPHVAVTFAVGLTLALALIAYETFGTSVGMFHHGLFGNRNFPIAAACVFTEGVAFFAATIYFAFQVGVLYEHDALLVGTRYSIMFIAAVVFACIAGWYCTATRRARWITVAAFLVFVVFFACMASTTRGSDAPVWGYTILMGAGLGMTLTTLVTVAQLSTPPHLISVASGLIISVRSVGGTTGIALYHALFIDGMHRLPANVAEAVSVPGGIAAGDLPAFVAALSNHNNSALASIHNASPEIISRGTIAMLDTYVVAFRHVWIAAGCFVAAAAIGSSFLFDPSKEFNMRVDAPMEREEEIYSY